MQDLDKELSEFFGVDMLAQNDNIVARTDERESSNTRFGGEENVFITMQNKNVNLRSSPNQMTIQPNKHPLTKTIEQRHTFRPPNMNPFLSSPIGHGYPMYTENYSNPSFPQSSTIHMRHTEIGKPLIPINHQTISPIENRTILMDTSIGEIDGWFNVESVEGLITNEPPREESYQLYFNKHGALQRYRRPLDVLIQQINQLLTNYQGDQFETIRLIQTKMLYMKELLAESPDTNITRFASPEEGVRILNASEQQIQHWFNQLLSEKKEFAVSEPSKPKVTTKKWFEHKSNGARKVSQMISKQNFVSSADINSKEISEDTTKKQKTSDSSSIVRKQNRRNDIVVPNTHLFPLTAKPANLEEKKNQRQNVVRTNKLSGHDVEMENTVPVNISVSPYLSNDYSSPIPFNDHLGNKRRWDQLKESSFPPFWPH
eukprot:TRINITY_DN5701_c0_g1_i1.p1 TRINITY_DN5701_c0_g1~~TRINITY_DN5701_c0_g1_i1.p1  ORF type:complete len:443 (-),score=104.23 TRINITY_DN5701_c0_g1_i1:43-1332(-)